MTMHAWVYWRSPPPLQIKVRLQPNGRKDEILAAEYRGDGLGSKDGRVRILMKGS